MIEKINADSKNKVFELEDVNLTKEQKAKISEWLELLMTKYQRVANKQTMKLENNLYNEGITDGLNQAYKIINGIEDDYILKNE